MPEPVKTQSTSLTRRDLLIVTAALAVIFYGVLLLGCGGGNENTKEEPDPRTGSGGEAAAPEEPSEPDTVRFSLDDGGIEMAVPMQRYQRDVGGRVVPTTAVESGDWFLENFAYEGNRLVAVTTPPITDNVALAARHKHYDAEIAIWTVTERPQDAERYVDAIADDWIERIVVSKSLLDAIALNDQELTQARGARDSDDPALEGLHFGKVALAGRSALQVDLLRIQPGTRVRQHIQLVMLRQFANEASVMVFVGIAARRDDMPDLDGQLDEFASQLTLTGQGLPLALNPNRELGPAGDEYGVDWQLVLEGQAAEPPTASTETPRGLATDLTAGVSVATRAGLPDAIDADALLGPFAGDTDTVDEAADDSDADGAPPSDDDGEDGDVEDGADADSDPGGDGAADEGGAAGTDPISDDELPDVDPEGVQEKRQPRGL